MIDKNLIGNDVSTKLVNADIIDEIGYENEDFAPSEGATEYAFLTIVPATDGLVSNCTERSLFAIDIDVYVKAGYGSFAMNNFVRDIGDLFNPKTNHHINLGTQTYTILSAQEVQGAKEDDGWYFTTVRLNIVANKQ